MALNEVSNVLIRMRELSIQAANGTVRGQDRDTIDREFQDLDREYPNMVFPLDE